MNEKVIWKFDIELDKDFTLELREYYRILSIANQESTGSPVMWVLIDPNSPVLNVRFKTYWTGTFILDCDNWDYIGTIDNSGWTGLVHHLVKYKD